MKLNSDGVTISILILITMILICHTMNYLYPKNKFANIPKPTNNYNEIYYTNQNNKLCSSINNSSGITGDGLGSDNLLNQAEIPYDVISSCKTRSDGGSGGIGDDNMKNYLSTLSESELAVLYKVAYENTEREIIMRTLNDISTKTTKYNE